jgi:hypothetical protein
MLCQSDEDDIQLPSDPDYILPPTDRRKCRAGCVPFSDEGSISVSSPVEEINFKKQGWAQEQSTVCAAHVMAIGYRPARRYPLVVQVLIPSPDGKSDEIHLFVFLFCCIARLKVVFDIFEQQCGLSFAQILNFCCLLVFHGLHQTMMQFLLSGMLNTSRRIHISNGVWTAI